jgi:hypothetical protein
MYGLNCYIITFSDFECMQDNSAPTLTILLDLINLAIQIEFKFAFFPNIFCY